MCDLKGKTSLQMTERQGGQGNFENAGKPVIALLQILHHFSIPNIFQVNLSLDTLLSRCSCQKSRCGGCCQRSLDEDNIAIEIWTNGVVSIHERDAERSECSPLTMFSSPLGKRNWRFSFSLSSSCPSGTSTPMKGFVS